MAAIDSPAWQPEILHTEQQADERLLDHDRTEVWNWLHSRLRALGRLNADQAHLAALLCWKHKAVSSALSAARLAVDQLEHEDGARQVHVEFLAAEYLARQALGLESIPAPEPRAA